MKLSQFKALTFDCYGTLIDWESGMAAALKPLTAKVQRPLTRDQILEAHARHESFQQHETPAKRYSELLAVVYKRLAEEWGVPQSWEECLAYGNSIQDWPAFPDSADALAYLKRRQWCDRGAWLVVITNALAREKVIDTIQLREVE